MIEHRTDLQSKPILQRRSLLRIGAQFDAIPNFRQSDSTLTKSCWIGVEAKNTTTFHSAFGFPQLGENISIDQPSHQNVTSLTTGEGARGGEISTSG